MNTTTNNNHKEKKITRQWGGVLISDRLPKAQLFLLDTFIYILVNPFSLHFYVGGLGAESLLALSLQCLQNIKKNSIYLGSVVIPQCF